jgi:solute carrier family 40 (iron-regulated transporter), member 1
MYHPASTTGDAYYNNNSMLSTVSFDIQESSEQRVAVPSHLILRQVTSRLFVSHFLSTWNSRLFEMGAVLFLAAIFPETLLPMSVYALVRNGAAIALCPALGVWIDEGDRLKLVRVSIVGQRLAVGASCGVFWILYQRKELGYRLRNGLFVVAVLLACIEKLCSILNLVSVERDWVVVISQDDDSTRRILNARLRRIDLICKSLGPLVISLINGASTVIAIWVTLLMNCTSVLIEYFTIAAVFRMVPALRRTTAETNFTQSAALSLLPLNSIPYYFQHTAFLPSISLSLLYLTVLSFSGQMITFLLAVGYTSFAVGAARAISSIFELAATWISPIVQQHIGAVRGGIWFLTWQMLWLAGGLSWFFANGKSLSEEKILAASGLVGAVILSRVGLWGFDLCAQSIIQDEVNEQSRGAFSAVEVSFQNLLELFSYVTTIIFSRPDQFQWPAVISLIAVYVAGGTYAVFVRRRRGHLLHISNCIKPRLEGGRY